MYDDIASTLITISVSVKMLKQRRVETKIKHDARLTKFKEHLLEESSGFVFPRMLAGS